MVAADLSAQRGRTVSTAGFGAACCDVALSPDTQFRMWRRGSRQVHGVGEHRAWISSGCSVGRRFSGGCCNAGIRPCFRLVAGTDDGGARWRRYLL
jgi:hypothetical protein